MDAGPVFVVPSPDENVLRSFVAGLGLLALADPNGSIVADVLPGSLVAAAGMALVFIPATMTAIGGVAPAEGGLASGIVNTTYQVGLALGLAAMTAVAVANGAGQTTDPVELMSGYTTAFTVTAAVALAGALLAALTLRCPAHHSGSTEIVPAEQRKRQPSDQSHPAGGTSSWSRPPHVRPRLRSDPDTCAPGRGAACGGLKSDRAADSPMSESLRRVMYDGVLRHGIV